MNPAILKTRLTLHSMFLAVRHKTLFRYPGNVRDSFNEVRMEPLNCELQKRHSFSLQTEPAARYFSYGEPGGAVHHFSILHPHDHLEILTESIVETLNSNPFTDMDLVGEDWDLMGPAVEKHIEFLAPSRYVPAHPLTAEMGRQAKAECNGNVAQFFLSLNNIVHRFMRYDSKATDVHTTLEESLRIKAGVCQDFTHIMISAARSQGMPARYVSGYLHVGSNTNIKGFHATHAWVEGLLPSGVWVGFDPTNDLVANENHILVHTGRDYADAAPTHGIYKGRVGKAPEVEVAVYALDSLPRDPVLVPA